MGWDRLLLISSQPQNTCNRLSHCPSGSHCKSLKRIQTIVDFHAMMSIEEVSSHHLLPTIFDDYKHMVQRHTMESISKKRKWIDCNDATCTSMGRRQSEVIQKCARLMQSDAMSAEDVRKYIAEFM